jgi:hypothetical protein
MWLDKHLDWSKLQEVADRDIPYAHCTFYFAYFGRTVDVDCELDWYEVVSCSLNQQVDSFWIFDNASGFEIRLNGEAQVDFYIKRAGSTVTEPNPIRLFPVFSVVIRVDLNPTSSHPRTCEL